VEVYPNSFLTSALYGLVVVMIMMMIIIIIIIIINIFPPVV